MIRFLANHAMTAYLLCVAVVSLSLTVWWGVT